MNKDFLPSTASVGVFNASHDEALEFNNVNFTPSKTAQAIERDLALLPYWGYGCNFVLVPDVAECEAFLSRSPLLRRNCKPVSSLSMARGAELMPWGWDKAIWRKAQKAGVRTNIANGYLDMLRSMQERRFSSDFLQHINFHAAHYEKLKDFNFAGNSYIAESMGDIQFSLLTHGKCVLKRPISGSGRGVVFAEEMLSDRQSEWSEAILRKFGYIEVQPYCDKICDFAMEFHKEAGKPYEFLGYSEFGTSENGGYTGNFLSAGSKNGEDIWKILGAGQDVKTAFEAMILETLNAHAENCSGFLGIDMLLCQTPIGIGLFPCVEMNFRRTMGLFSNMLGISADAGSTAWFNIMFHPHSGETMSHAAQLARRFPAVKSCSTPGDERFLTGYVPLTPINEHTQFHAYLMFSHSKGFSDKQEAFS